MKKTHRVFVDVSNTDFIFFSTPVLKDNPISTTITPIAIAKETIQFLNFLVLMLLHTILNKLLKAKLLFL